MASPNPVNTPIATAPTPMTVTEQLREARSCLESLCDRMESLITRAGVGNEVCTNNPPVESQQFHDTRNVVMDINDICAKLHNKMESLDRIA